MFSIRVSWLVLQFLEDIQKICNLTIVTTAAVVSVPKLYLRRMHIPVWCVVQCGIYISFAINYTISVVTAVKGREAWC